MNKTKLLTMLILGFLFMPTNKKHALGIRNNNAGNIRATGNWQQWQGAINENRGFIVFDEPENGLRAMARILRNYRDLYQINTIEQIINRWAPPSENDTQSYINSVVQKVGIASSEPLMPDNYPSLMAAITYHENGEQPYTSEQLYTGFERGFT